MPKRTALQDLFVEASHEVSPGCDELFERQTISAKLDKVAVRNPSGLDETCWSAIVSRTPHCSAPPTKPPTTPPIDPPTNATNYSTYRPSHQRHHQHQIHVPKLPVAHRLRLWLGLPVRTVCRTPCQAPLKLFCVVAARVDMAVRRRLL